MARDTHDPAQRQVAVKTVALTSARDAQRFRAEARALAVLEHPNIVRVLDLWDDGTTGLVVMEFLQGHTLANRAGQLTTATIIEWAIAICGALDYLHRRGIVHRDLGPRNVFVCDPSGIVKLIDFGLALNLEDATGTFGGTPAFMAREQREPPYVASARSDLYSLGAVIYFLYTTRSPHELEDADRFRDFSAPEMLPLLEGLLADNVKDRYASARAVAEDLRALGTALRDGEPPPPLRRHGVTLQLKSSSDLVARAEVRAILDRALASARLGTGAVITCSAASGLGKSSLVRGFVRDAVSKGALCLQAGGLDLARSLAYGALKEALAGLVDLIESGEISEDTVITAAAGREAEVVSVAPELTSVLPEGHSVYGHSESALQQYALELGRFLAGLGETAQPIIVWIDDVQWVDESSWRVFERLAHEVARRPVIVLLTAREEGAERLASLTSADATPLILLPLNDTDITALFADMFGAEVRDAARAAAFVATAAGGNPFFVWEVCRDLAEASAFAFDASGAVTWDGDIAARVAGHVTPSELLLARLHRLSPAEREVLGRAAVWGRKFEASAVGAKEGLLLRLMELGLLEAAGEGVYTFTHDKLREGAQALLSLQEQHEYHAAVGRVRLAQGEAGSALAVEHFVAAADYAQAAAAANAAAKDAERRQALDTAYDFYRRLVGWQSAGLVTLTKAAQAELLRRAGQAALRLGRYRDAVDLIERWLGLSAQEVHNPVLRAQGFGQQAEAHLRLGDVDSAVRLHEAAAATLGVRIPKARVPLIAFIVGQTLIALFFALIGDNGRKRLQRENRQHQEAVARLTGFVLTLYYFDSVRCLGAQLRALNIAERLRTCPEKIQMFGQHAALSLVVPGFTKRCLAYGRAAVSMAQALTDEWSELFARTHLMFGYYAAGQFPAALAQISEGETLARRVRDPLLVGLLRQHDFFIRLRRGHLLAAEELAGEVRALYETYRDPLGVLDGNAYLPQLLADTGRFAEAETLARAMHTQATALNAKQEIVESSGQVAYVAWAKGDAQQALSAARESLHASVRFGLRNVHIGQVSGRMLLALAANPQVRLAFVAAWHTRLTLFYGLAISSNYRAFNLWALGRFLEARGWLRLASAAFERAIRSAERAQLPLDRARAVRDLAFLQIRRGRPLSEVQEAVGASWQVFTASGAVADSRMLAESWTDHGGSGSALISAASVGDTTAKTQAPGLTAS